MSTAEMWDRDEAAYEAAGADLGLVYEARPLELRPLQLATLDKVRDAWKSGARRVLVQAPCGFGKTEIATAMLQAAHENGSRSIFLCDRISLVNQTSERFDRYGLRHGVQQGAHWRFQPWQKVQVCSVQTIQSRKRWPEHSLLVVDEAHVLPRAVKERLRKNEGYAVGLTATPFTKGLGRYFDALVNATTTNELIAQGWLTPFRIFAASEPDMTGAKLRNDGEWKDEEAEKRVLPIVGDCVAEYMKRGNHRKFVAFAVSVAHAEALQRQFLESNVKVDLYTYRQSDAEREASVEEFRKPDSYIRGLISIESLTRGFDVPDVGVLILARPLRKSLAVHMQMIGRVLRTAPGKEDAIILDHSSNCVRFWGPMQEYLEYGATYLDDGRPKDQDAAGPTASTAPEPRKCPKCAHVHTPRPICPACGYEYPRKKSLVEHQAGELFELAAGDRSRDERELFYAQLVYIGASKGYKSAWPDFKYREKFGEMPRIPRPEPILPTPQVLRWVRSRQIAYAKGRAKAKSS